MLGRATLGSDYPPPSARPDPDSSTKSGLLPPRLGKNSNNIWEARLRRGSSSSLPFQCPSLFLVPFTQLLGIPVPVAAQRVSSSFLSSPRLFFFFFNPFKAIRFFSLFPLLSSSTPSPSLGALPSRGPAPGQTLRPSSFQPVVAGPRNSGGGCWTKGGGAGGGGACDCCSARCPHSTAPGRPHPFPDCGLRLLG